MGNVGAVSDIAYHLIYVYLYKPRSEGFERCRAAMLPAIQLLPEPASVTWSDAANLTVF